ncbi:MAG: hypothetical protein CSA38_01945 [Flavobacteriales bacterium]|nr:MAG: hypothetical protein CSA38_01945 [Flavobacteriales bacterium]
MIINNFILDVLKGHWLVEGNAVEQYETLLNNYVKGSFQGTKIDRSGFVAGLSNASFSPSEEKKEKKIITVPMRGILPAYGGMCILGADDYLSIFRRLNSDNEVGAVILDIDGPGSSVSAINLMKEFAEERKKPFVALMNSCYSGHYWTASMLCDHLMAYGDISSGFGSIGVLSTVYDDREANEKKGYKVKVIRAPQSTTKAQTMVDFYSGNDDEFTKSLEDEMRPMADAFINAVKEYRPHINQGLEGLFTGSTFNANVSLENGLIDSIGNHAKAVERAKILMELQEE